MHCQVLKSNYHLQNPEMLQNYHSNIDLAALCSDVNYVLILPFSKQQATNPKNFGTIPYVITYTQDTTRIKDIIEKYRNELQTPINSKILVTLSSGFQLYQEISMRVLQRSLNRESLNGIILFTQIDKNQAYTKEEEQYLNYYSSSDQDQYIDQCCIGDFLDVQKEAGTKKDLKFFVEIPLADGRTQLLTLRTTGEDLGKDIKNSIIKAFKQEYSLNIQQNAILSLKIKDAKQETVVKQEIQVKKQHIFQNSKLILTLADPKLPLKRIKTKEYNSYIVIFKEGQVEPTKFKYHQISELTFSQLYLNKLELKQSRIKKDAVYCLKIMDMLIKPNEKINVAEKYFKNQSNNPLKVVGKVVNQKEVFYHTVPMLSNNEEKFNIDEHIKIPQNQQIRRNQCRNKSKARAQKTTHQYFKVQQRLEPILIYTSDLQYYQQKGKTSKIYEALNRFLRDTPFLTLKEENVKKEWRYIYSSFLLKHLQKIPMFKGETYRGVSYDPQVKVDQILTFKQFVSTSVDKKTAMSFATRNNNKVKQMFVLNIKQGYPIKEYSDFINQQEVLLEPYSDFKVVKIQETVQTIKFKDPKGKEYERTYPFKIYHLDQILTSKKLPEIKGNFVVWLDNKPKQGKPKQSKLIFDKINIPHETTLLIPLQTTLELKNWMVKNNFLLTDPTANLIFITNMGRTEGEKFNQIAGVEALREIRKYDPMKPVFFYIGDIDKTKKKLVDNGIDLKDVTVGNTPKQVYFHIIKQISGGK